MEVGKTVKKVFITGATGFMGFHVARKLASRPDYHIKALVRETADKERLGVLANMGIETVPGSLENQEAWKSSMSGSDCVVHFAALRGSGRGCAEQYDRVNIKGTEDLLKHAFQAAVRRFIFCSSAGVHGTVPSELPAGVNTPRHGDTLYHFSKIEAEKAVLSWREKGMEGVIIRPLITYGEGDDGFPFKLVRMVRRRKLLVPFPDITVHLLDATRLAELVARLLEEPRFEIPLLIAADARPVSLSHLVNIISRETCGRAYPRILRCPAIFYRAGALLAHVLKQERWKVPLKLFSSSWYYVPGPLPPEQPLSRTESAFPAFASAVMGSSGKRLRIERSWRKYFSERHEGLGTTYERFILHDLFSRIGQKIRVKNMIEVPSFGMTGVSGINSLWWTERGVPVTVTDHSKERLAMIRDLWAEIGIPGHFTYIEDYSRLPFADRAFSLAWNFSALWFVQDLKAFLEELSRITEKAIFLCVPNRLGMAQIVRRFSRSAYKNIRPEHNIPSRFSGILAERGWHLGDQGYFDIPPWPDIAMGKEDFFKRLGLGWMGKPEGDERKAPLCILDYFKGERRDMEEMIRPYAFLEHAPWPVSRFWAHHRYFLFTRESG